MFKKILALCLVTFMLAASIPAVAEDAVDAFPTQEIGGMIDDSYAIAVQYANDLMGGEKNEELYEMLTDQIKAQIPREAFDAMWSQITAAYGDFEGFGNYRLESIQGFSTHLLQMNMSKQKLLLQFTLDSNGKVAGLFFKDGKLLDTPAEANAENQDIPQPAGFLEESGLNDDGKAFAVQFAMDMMSGEKNDDLYAMFNDMVKAQFSKETFASLWAQVQATCGSFVAFGNYSVKDDTWYTAHELYMDMEKQDIILRLLVDKNGLVGGLNFALPSVATPAVTEEITLPDGLVEEEVTVGEGEWALPGVLTLPKDGTNLPAVVLVHGSGPNNRDESVGQTKMFRDLAWALAQKGIASIRYDKRTLTYANKFSFEFVKTLTVREETIIDAVLAGKVLKADSRIDGSRIFVAGHSLGAMLGPRIAKEGEGLYAGMILMNGSPLQLTDIILTQNEDQLAKQPEDVRKALQLLVDMEVEKLKGIDAMTDDQLKEEIIFGMPGYYVKDLCSYDAASTMKELQMTAIIIQGGADFQVSLENGWEAWQTAVGNESHITMRLYPELNHLLMKYTGDPVYQYSVQEYSTPARMDETVSNDIAAWILEH